MAARETLDPFIHPPVRLSIMTVLMTVSDADFNYLKEATGTTDGNLSAHLIRLQEAGYVKVLKGYLGRRPHTTCSLTITGRRAYEKYIRVLETYLRPGT